MRCAMCESVLADFVFILDKSPFIYLYIAHGTSDFRLFIHLDS